MRRARIFLFLAPWGLLASAGCGGRTTLEQRDTEAGATPDLSDASDDDPSTEGGYVYCEPLKGPVPASEVLDGSLLPRCNANFPQCVDVGGQWACCTAGPGPYNGPSGSCYF